MATNVMSLFASMGLDADKFSSGMEKAKSDFDQMGNQIKSEAGSTVDKVTDEFKGMGKEAGGGFNLLQSIATGAFTGMTTMALDVVANIAGTFVNGFKNMALGPVNLAADYDAAMGLMQSRTGETGNSLNWLGDISKEVWKNGFGGPIKEASTAITDVYNVLKDVEDGSDYVQSVTEAAFGLQDAFGVDMSATVGAAKTLMQKFGMTGDQAMDFITAGMQKGMNSSGDFLDTIGEYSNLFSENGATADQFFSVMETGLQSGVLGTDKAADAFKEFGIRIKDQSDTTRKGLTSIGIDWQALETSMTNGSLTGAQAYQMVLDKLNATGDPLLQNQAGVALFGTQWEDMGAKAMLATSTTATNLETLAGSTDSLNAQYNTLPALWEGLSRGFQASFMGSGQTILDMLNQIFPDLQSLVDWFAVTAAPYVEQFATPATTYIKDWIEWIKNDGMKWLQDTWAWWQNEALPQIEQFVDQAWKSINEWYTWFTQIALPYIQQQWQWWTQVAYPAISSFISQTWAVIKPWYDWFVNEVIGDIETQWLWWRDVAYPMVAEFITRAKAIIDPWLKDFKTAWAEIGPKFAEAWDKIKSSMDRLWVALEPIRKAFGDMGGENGEGGLVLIFDLALGALKTTLDIIVPVIDGLAVVIGLAADGLDIMVGFVEDAIWAWEQLQKVWDALTHPESVMPGSLPPLAQGISDTNAQLAAMNSLMGSTSGLMGSFGAGAGNITRIANTTKNYNLSLSSLASQSSVITNFRLLESIS